MEVHSKSAAVIDAFDLESGTFTETFDPKTGEYNE